VPLPKRFANDTPCRKANQLMILRSLSRLGTAQILAQEQLTQRSVATVLEGARGIPRRNRLQRLAHRLEQHLAATSFSFT
jgi:predicted XRE-type DNA-binding protein